MYLFRFLLIIFFLNINNYIKCQSLSGNVQYDSEVFNQKDSSYKVKKSLKVNFKGNIFSTQPIIYYNETDFGERFTLSGKPSKPLTPDELVIIKKLVKQSKSSKSFFDLNKNIIIRQELFDNLFFIVQDSNYSLTFDLSNDTCTISNIFCQKAIGTGVWLGWEYWFAPKIPTGAGHFSISGFPGLLIQAINNTTKTRIRLTTLEYPSVGKFKVPFNIEKIFTRKEFEEFKKKEIKKNAIGSKVE